MVKLSVGSRSFFVSGPTVWNALPAGLSGNPTLSILMSSNAKLKVANAVHTADETHLDMRLSRVSGVYLALETYCSSALYKSFTISAVRLPSRPLDRNCHPPRHTRTPLGC